MLQFFRKYQKIFFFVVTAAVIISFTFFGTYSAFGQGPQIEDREIEKGIAGKPIYQVELNALCHLIGTSPFDQRDRGTLPNFLNDGVIEKDFIANGLGVMLSKQYFEALKPELDQRVQKIKNFRPYVHPHSSQINAESVWARFSPALAQRYQHLKSKSDQATLESFALMSHVFLEQARLPAETLRQVLYMQQNQLHVPVDPALESSDLSLFGFKNVEEWFGPHFVAMAAQCILNGAQLAKERGYVVTKDEVRTELFENIYQGAGKISGEEAHNYYLTAMRQMGMNEETLIKSWQSVMLYRRLLEDVSGSVLLDPLAFYQFEAFTKENVVVDLYQLPEAFRFSDFLTMIRFQVYLESVAKDPSSLQRDLNLPSELAAVDAIEKRAPELVERQYSLEWASVNKVDLTRQISVRETWEWEGVDANWELLKKNFAELKSSGAQTKMERLKALEQLDSPVRLKIDAFARNQMIEAHPEKLTASLALAPLRNEEFGLRKGAKLPFGSKENASEIIELLGKAPLRTEPTNAVAERLKCYTSDKETYYYISVLERSDEKRVLSFEEANKDGTMSRMLDAKLEAAYPDVRKKDPRSFQKTDGQFKPLAEVKEQLSKQVFATLLKSIEEQCGKFSEEIKELPSSFYSNARLYPYMTQVKNGTVNARDMQWHVQKEEKKIERCTEVSFSKEALFLLSDEAWSQVEMGRGGGVTFYQVRSHAQVNTPPLASLEQGHQILGMDARRDLFQQLLKKMDEKKALDPTYSYLRE